MLTGLDQSVTIGLYDVELHGHIGLLKQEETLLQTYRVEVEVTVPGEDVALRREDLNASVSYADLYEIVERRISEGGALLETVAVDIAERILSRWEHVESGYVRLLKLNPPICGMKGSAGIKYFFRKKAP